MTTQPAVEESGDRISCWCCGQEQPEASVVRLGNHPEVAVCLRCAHFLHQQARGREDAQRASPAARARDALRTVRRAVIRRGWHRKAFIGPLLRRLGRHTP
jgi:ribosome-binding protein aMBF1 (putative translation factor)